MTKALSQHPDAKRLTEFGSGKLNDTEVGEIATHLDSCVRCQRAMDAQPDDALVALVRKVLRSSPGQAGTATLVESWLPTELISHPRYRLLRWLGAGGMGVVFEAEHRLMERPVAIKIISKQLTDDSAVVERFKKEVKAAARLSHPNIVTAYDAEQAGDLHFLVMELIEGRSLAKVVDDGGPLTVGLACDYVRQAALGLQHAFEQGMVHRDIKPQNLMLTLKGQVKILDFGLAAFVSKSGKVGSLTEFGQAMGTPDYVSPEQIRDARSADIRADIYSLGCTLYFLLTGLPPFSENLPIQKITGHLERTPRPVSSLRSDLPDGLAEIVERMMAKSPDQRFQKPIDVAEALTPFSRLGVQVRHGPKGWYPPKLYLIGGFLLAAILTSVFLFDVPGMLSSPSPPKKEGPPQAEAPKAKQETPRTKEDPPRAEEKKSPPGVDVDGAKFADVHIEKPYRDILLGNPFLMETPGAKIIKTPEGNFLLVGIASTVLKNDSPAERLRAEQVCNVKALREVVATTQGVTIGSLQRSEDRMIFVSEKDGTQTKTVQDYFQVTTAKVEGMVKGMAVIGRWKSKDGTLLYIAVGQELDRAAIGDTRDKSSK